MIKNAEDRVVLIGTTQTPASLVCPIAIHNFAFNPDEVKWGFTNKTVSRDTIGGRVVQLLSSRVDDMTVVGRAGSRGELQQLAKNLKKLMEYQLATQFPVHFKVPSKRWNFKVYIQNVSSLGWDYATTSYPYELTLLVQEDLTGLVAKSIEKQALERIAEGIGYSSKLHGGKAEDALKISEAYLNSMTFLKSRQDANLTSVADADKLLENTPIVPSGDLGDVLVQIAKTQLGVPYVWAAQQEGVAFDCSGFTSWVYEKATGHDMPHKASMQQDLFTYVGRYSLQKGNLVFFNFGRLAAGIADHVGIYIGNGQMIDASSSLNSVVIRNVFWSNFLGGGRPPSTWTLLDKYKN